jgi:hypothetical protein
MLLPETAAGLAQGRALDGDLKNRSETGQKKKAVITNIT